MALFDKPLFIFEMANNHQGSVEHGKAIIRAMKEVAREYESIFDFAVKFQYRDLDTFIHPDYQQRYDIKNVKRFQETRLSEAEFLELKAEAERQGMYTVCTPFNEVSADRVADQGYDAIKIASCSFGDWPLLERVAEKGLPVIASGAGNDMATVRNVVDFFNNRGIDLTLMHCVAEYPTGIGSLQMNQLDLYRQVFPGVRDGFSTHEEPSQMLPVQIAVSKGAAVFEKHVGVVSDGISLNAYSANPDQVRQWLTAAKDAFDACGVAGTRYRPSEKERTDLMALRRGVFAGRALHENESVDAGNSFLAFPCQPGQLTADYLSKYNRIWLNREALEKNAPIMLSDVTVSSVLEPVRHIVRKLALLLAESHVVVPVGSRCELSHHYGIEHFHETGVTMIDCVNREYCKKILILLPGQNHPPHYHIQKEETFVILHGTLSITLEGTEKLCHKGDVVTVERNAVHSFSSEYGCVFEEISTTHYQNDSYYANESEFVAPRKTKIYFTKDMLEDINR